MARRRPIRNARGATGAAAAAAAWLALVLGAATRVAAQCAMCGQATGYAGASPRQAILTFAVAAAVLLVPTLLLAGALGRLLWKHRH